MSDTLIRNRVGPDGLVVENKEGCENCACLQQELKAAKAKINRVLIALGPHIPLRWREELESITGERLFFGGRDPRAPR